MVSYVQPSKQLSKLLSSYLEFDEKQMQLGLWNGDLSLSDVNIRRDAVEPLLNPSPSPGEQANDVPPLRVVLKSGTVGHLSVKVPWSKILGMSMGYSTSSEVTFEVSDVTIVLALESESATKSLQRLYNHLEEDEEEEEDLDGADGESRLGRKRDETDSEMKGSESSARNKVKRRRISVTREEKQRYLREAEGHLLRSLSLPDYPPDGANDILPKSKSSDQQKKKSDGGVFTSRFWERTIRSTASSMMWRLLVGLNATIRNVRVVLVQDGVEVGFTNNLLRVSEPGKKPGCQAAHAVDGGPNDGDGEREGDHELKKPSSGRTSAPDDSSVSEASRQTPPPSAGIPSLNSDDSKLWKDATICGCGIFLRKDEGRTLSASKSRDNIPQPSRMLRRDLRLNLDDFVVHPSESSISLCIFRSAQAACDAGATDGASGTSSKNKAKITKKKSSESKPTLKSTASTVAASKRMRRGKREKRSGTTSATSSLSEATSRSPVHDVDVQAIERPQPVAVDSNGSQQTNATPYGDGRSQLLFAPENLRLVGHLPPEGGADESPVCPQVDLRWSTGHVQTVCSTHHFRLLSLLVSVTSKERNGRPFKRISAVLPPTRTQATKSGTPVVDNISLVSSRHNYQVGSSHPSVQNPQRETVFSRRRRFIQTAETRATPPERTRVVRSWWHYAILNVLREVRRRRARMSSGDCIVRRGRFVPFDWKKQRRLRKDYVDLYIAVRLERYNFAHDRSAQGQTSVEEAEGRLLEIEDELPVEQILLYRQISRSLKIEESSFLARLVFGTSELTHHVGHSHRRLMPSPAFLRRSTSEVAHDGSAEQLEALAPPSPEDNALPPGFFLSMKPTFNERAMRSRSTPYKAECPEPIDNGREPVLRSREGSEVPHVTPSTSPANAHLPLKSDQPGAGSLHRRVRSGTELGVPPDRETFPSAEATLGRSATSNFRRQRGRRVSSSAVSFDPAAMISAGVLGGEAKAVGNLFAAPNVGKQVTEEGFRETSSMRRSTQEITHPLGNSSLDTSRKGATKRTSFVDVPAKDLDEIAEWGFSDREDDESSMFPRSISKLSVALSERSSPDRKAMEFSVLFSVASFSFTLCADQSEIHSVRSKRRRKVNGSLSPPSSSHGGDGGPSDDISALTGFSDESGSLVPLRLHPANPTVLVDDTIEVPSIPAVLPSKDLDGDLIMFGKSHWVVFSTFLHRFDLSVLGNSRRRRSVCFALDSVRLEVGGNHFLSCGKELCVGIELLGELQETKESSARGTKSESHACADVRSLSASRVDGDDPPFVLGTGKVEYLTMGYGSENPTLDDEDAEFSVDVRRITLLSELTEIDATVDIHLLGDVVSYFEASPPPVLSMNDLGKEEDTERPASVPRQNAAHNGSLDAMVRSHGLVLSIPIFDEKKREDDVTSVDSVMLIRIASCETAVGSLARIQELEWPGPLRRPRQVVCASEVTPSTEKSPSARSAMDESAPTVGSVYGDNGAKTGATIHPKANAAEFRHDESIMHFGRLKELIGTDQHRLSLLPSPESRGLILCVHGIELDVGPGNGDGDGQLTHLVRKPVSVDFLVSSVPRSWHESSTQIEVSMSPLEMEVSERRVSTVSSLFELCAAQIERASVVSGFKSAPTKKHSQQVTLSSTNGEANSRDVTLFFLLSMESVQVFLKGDDGGGTSHSQKRHDAELIFEEAISDFLSQLSCFDLQNPCEEATKWAEQMCVDRLSSGDVSEAAARQCARAARQKFLEDLDFIKESQVEALEEIAAEAESSGNKRNNDENRKSLSAVSREGERPPTSSINYDESWDADSEESMDIIETAIRNAVEQSLVHAASVSERTTQDWADVGQTFLIAKFDGLLASFVKYPNRTELKLAVRSTELRSMSGIYILKIRPFEDGVERPTRQESVDVDVSSLGEKSGEQFGRRNNGKEQITLMVRSEMHREPRGLSIQSVENHHPLGAPSRKEREPLVERSSEVSVGSIEILFSACIWSTALHEMRRLAGEDRQGEAKDAKNAKLGVRKHCWKGQVETCSVLLASEELQPFVRMQIWDFFIENGKSPRDYAYSSEIHLMAGKAQLWNLTPEGQAYPAIICPIAIFEGKSEMQIQARLLLPRDAMKHGSDLSITISNVRVFFVYQFVNELVQYLSDTNYGVSLFLKKLRDIEARDAESDVQDGKPTKLKITLRNSNFIAPRDCGSSELVAINADTVVYEKGIEEVPWLLEKESHSKEKQHEKDDSTFHPFWTEVARLSNSKEVDDESLRDALKSDIFHDCYINPVHDSSKTLSGDSRSGELRYAVREDSSIPAEVSESADGALKDKLKIPRQTVMVRGGRILTALGPSAISKDLPRLRQYMDIGNVLSGADAFTDRRSDLDAPTRNDDEGMIAELLTWKWEEVTESIVNLDVLIERDPCLRLLFRDPSRQEPELIVPINLSMRMSQFYLLLSLWYGNMQELPVMFPLAEEDIIDRATHKKCPSDWPEYGSAAFTERLKKGVALTVEIGVSFRQVAWRLTFDERGYFGKDPETYDTMKNATTSSDGNGIIVRLGGLKVLTSTDVDGLTRVAAGATTVNIIDRRTDFTIFSNAYSIDPDRGGTSDKAPGSERDAESSMPGAPSRIQHSHAEYSWGIDCGQHTLGDELPLPFQVTVFLSPDSWCLVNLGISEADAAVADLSTIWIILDYFGAYFADAAFGHPFFAAENQKKHAKKLIRQRLFGEGGIESAVDDDPASLSLDFRLWLIRPQLVIPSDALDPQKRCLSIGSRSGVMYRFTSIGNDVSVQEICTNGLDLTIIPEFESPKSIRSSDNARQLVERLSFGLLYVVDARSNFTNISVVAPLEEPSVVDSRRGKGLESLSVHVPPITLPSALICKPMVRPKRKMGVHICDVMLSPEDLLLTSKLLGSFVGVAVSEDEVGVETKAADETALDGSDGVENFTGAVSISGIQLFLCDPVLKMHRPLSVICLSRLRGSASQVPFVDDQSRGDVRGGDLQVAVDVTFWIDYFKVGTCRNWEPFVEPSQGTIMYEKSEHRGQGIVVTSESPLHFNITSALLETIDESVDSVSELWSSLTGDDAAGSEVVRSSGLSLQETHWNQSPFDQGTSSICEELITGDSGEKLKIIHKASKPMRQTDRVAFSLLNKTGDRMRFHQLGGSLESSSTSTTNVCYIDEAEETKLNFQPTMSVIRNLRVIETPIDHRRDPLNGDFRYGIDTSHFIAVQIPGFRWVKKISIDLLGRRFEDLDANSPVVAQKMKDDWRLNNALKLLGEVSSVNGGRQVLLRSPIEIINKTSHVVTLALHPDRRHQPSNSLTRNLKEDADLKEDAADLDGEAEADGSFGIESKVTASDGGVFGHVSPGEAYQLPLFLMETALHLKGSNLGSVWIRPDQSDRSKREHIASLVLDEAISSGDNPKSSIGFCSRAVEISELVNESCSLFQHLRRHPQGNQSPITGIQVSCPTVHEGIESVSVTPFCYILEVRRSPLVPVASHKKAAGILRSSGRGGGSAHTSKGSEHGNGNNNEENHSSVASVSGNMTLERNEYVGKGSRVKTSRNPGGSDTDAEFHGPVAYSMTLHPPIVLENLLPERGRFQLINSTTRKILWWGDLCPGESVPIHTVGLDAPLLMLINLGYCRTPVGEGALVHHGVESSTSKGGSSIQNVGKSIGKAVITSTNKVKKTFTNLGEADDETGTNNGVPKQTSGEELVAKDDQPARKASKSFIQSAAQFTNVMAFGVDDIATETTLVDSLGQRLNLCIDNELGGGGQRRITIYCPFWIVNMTEHSLRYKQEKSNAFVAGTISGENREEPPVDAKVYNRGETEDFGDTLPGGSRSTIFAGMPGALSSSPGNPSDDPRTLSMLIQEDLPLESIVPLSFMFNFNEGVSGQQKLAVQLAETAGRYQYLSDWSTGISLESVGVPQIVGMHCRDGRNLEVTSSVTVAPGRLSQYTKLVRFSPRYVLVNQLQSQPIRVWQDNSLLHPVFASTESGGRTGIEHQAISNWVERGSGEADQGVINQYEFLFGGSTLVDHRQGTGMTSGTTAHFSAMYITTAGNSEMIPFHLPDTRADRQLRIDFGTPWNLTSSFPADITGEYTLRRTREVDLRLFRHVTTRAAPKYRITLPPDETNEHGYHRWDGELGIWMETERGSQKIVVKGTKQGKYASTNTDVRVGDELVAIDDRPVSQLTFVDAMALLKRRLVEISYAERSNTTPEHRGKSNLTKAMTTKFLRPFQKTSMPVTEASGPSDDSYEPKPPKLILTFRTLEERMRRIRMKAARAKNSNHAHSGVRSTNPQDTRPPDSNERHVEKNDKVVRNFSSSNSEVLPTDLVTVDMKLLNESIFVFVRSAVIENPPYRIENRSVSHLLYFRQRGCSGHPWNCLLPGETVAYAWEEPMKPKKLTLRSGKSHVFLHGQNADEKSKRSLKDDYYRPPTGRALRNRGKKLTRRLTPRYVFRFVEDEEQGGLGPPKTVKLEEIGYSDTLQGPGLTMTESRGEQQLHCRVDTEGATRVLVVSDTSSKSYVDETDRIEAHLETVSKDIEHELANGCRFMNLKHEIFPSSAGTEANEVRVDELSPKRKSLFDQPIPEEIKSDDGEDNATDKRSAQVPPTKPPVAKEGAGDHVDSRPVDNMSDVVDLIAEAADCYPDGTTITACNQVLVEVVEAAGLRPADLGGLSNPYCEVQLIGSANEADDKHTSGQSTKKHRTYFVEKSLAPKWSNMVFVFDVPPIAASRTRGFSIQVQVRHYGFLGRGPHLGQAEVHLVNCKNQREVVGWYPLMGRTGRRELQGASGRVRGSVKLRIQWIFSVPALLDYYISYSENRVADLVKLRDGLEQQRGRILESAKERKDYLEPLSLVPVPSITGLSSKRRPRRSGPYSAKKMEKALVLSSRESFTAGKWKLLRQHMKILRQKQLRSLSLQTEESRRIRHGSNDEPRSGSSLENFEVGESLGSGRISRAGRSHDSAAFSKDSSDNVQLDRITSSHMEKKNVDGVGYKGRVRGGVLDVITEELLSSGSVQAPSESLSGGEDEGKRKRRIRDSLSLNETSNDGRDLLERQKLVKNLYDAGLLHHEGDFFFHRRHFTHHVRSELSIPHRSQGKQRRRHTIRIPSHPRHFDSWIVASAYLNDGDFAARITGKDSMALLNNGHKLRVDHGALSAALGPPPGAPEEIRERAHANFEKWLNARENFGKASKQSLRSVLTPGGWLIIRPLTALNLPETYMSMSVHMQCGSVVRMTQSVNARVAPSWASEDFDASTCNESGEPRSSRLRFSKISQRQREREVEFGCHENDLEWRVEPLRTSGSLRLSVVGERLQSRAELGYLRIPIGAAISCCCETNDVGDTSDETPKKPYVRWFPLMNPKHAARTEGDLGVTNRPTESEKTSDLPFSQAFTPCIKLAILWEPDREEETEYVSPDDATTNSLGARLSTEIYFKAAIASVSAALIDSVRATELISFTTTELDCRFSITTTKTRFGLSIGWIQLDQQGELAREPVVLAPTPVLHPQPTFQLMAVKDNHRSKSTVESYDYVVLWLQELDLRIEEALLFGLWDFYVRIVRRRDLRKSRTNALKSRSSLGYVLNHDVSGISPTFTDGQGDAGVQELVEVLHGRGVKGHPNPNSREEVSKVYIKQLRLGYVKVNLSYVKSVRGSRMIGAETPRPDSMGSAGDADISEEPSEGKPESHQHSRETLLQRDLPYRSEEFRRWSEQEEGDNMWHEAGSGLSHNLPYIVSAVFPSITGAPIRLQGKVIEHVFESAGEIKASLKSYYVTETLKQVYKIIGSLDIVGNPTMVLRSLLTGVRDFFVQPSVELIQSPSNPSRVGLGVLKGTLSLFSHSTSGVFAFASNMSSAAGYAAVTLSFDDDFRRWHAQQTAQHERMKRVFWQRRGLNHVVPFLVPVKDVVYGVVFAASGVIVQPFYAARKDGVVGFGKKLGIGMVGLVTKPLAGVFDAFAHLSEAMRDVARSVNVLDKQYEPVSKHRLPYVFGVSDRLSPFDPVTSRGVELLRFFALDKDASISAATKSGSGVEREERMVLTEVLHMEPGVDNYVIVTTVRVLLAEVRADELGRTAYALYWQISFSRGTQIISQIESIGHVGIALFIDVIRGVKRSDDESGSRHDGVVATGGAGSQHKEMVSADKGVNSSFALQDASEDGIDFEEVDHVVGFQAGDFARSIRDDRIDRNVSFGAQSGSNSQRYPVYGEFQHRSAIARIHNAICCLTGAFSDLVRDESMRLERGVEGYTKFGNLHFGRETPNSDLAVSSETRVFSMLGNLIWMGGLDREVALRKLEHRRSWLFRDELELSRMDRGPLWLVRARAQATFSPPAPPTLERHVDSKDEVVVSTFDRLRRGLISYRQAEDIIRVHGRKVLFLRSTMGKTISMENFHAFVNELEGKERITGGERQLSRRRSSLASISSDDLDLESREKGEKRVATSTEAPVASDAVATRLDRVEKLLEQVLVLQLGEQNRNLQTLDAAPPSPVRSDHSPRRNATFESRNEQEELHFLRSEVSALRRRLNEVTGENAEELSVERSEEESY